MKHLFFPKSIYFSFIFCRCPLSSWSTQWWTIILDKDCHPIIFHGMQTLNLCKSCYTLYHPQLLACAPLNGKSRARQGTCNDGVRGNEPLRRNPARKHKPSICPIPKTLFSSYLLPLTFFVAFILLFRKKQGLHGECFLFFLQ